VHCDYNYPHTPANSHNLYKVINHKNIFRRSIAILRHTKHGHKAQGLDLPRLLDVCMHITTYLQCTQWHNNSTLYCRIRQHQAVKTIHMFIVMTATVTVKTLFLALYISWMCWFYVPCLSLPKDKDFSPQYIGEFMLHFYINCVHLLACADGKRH